MSAKTVRTILLTRPKSGSEAVRPLFESAGFRVLIQPMVELLPPTDFSGADRAMARREKFDWLIFSSAHGVRFFFERAAALDGALKGARSWESAKIAAVGPGTASALTEFARSADLVPAEHRAEGLIAALEQEARRGARFLSIRGDRGRDLLKTELTALGGSVEEISVYQSVDTQKPDEKIARLLGDGKIDAVTVTSSAIAATLVRLFGAALKKTALVSISPLTSETLRALGYDPALEAQTATMEGIRAALVTAPCFRSEPD